MRRVAVVALLLTLAVSLSNRSAFAAAPVITDLRIEQPSGLTVGDHLRYLITIEADQGTSVSLAPGALPGSLELTAPPRTTSRSSGQGRVSITLSLELAAFVTGLVEVPQIKLQYRTQEGASGDLLAPASSFSVQSVLTQDDLAPRPLKPQLALPGAGAALLTPLLAGVLVAALVSAVVMLQRRQRRLRLIALPAAPEPFHAIGPEDRARAELDRAGAAFGSDGDFHSYYGVLAVTVRNYLTERHGFPAFALTTRELEEQMLHRGLDRWQTRLASGLLSQCDAVVYARYRPASERADADLTAAYEIVEISRPQEANEEVAVT